MSADVEIISPGPIPEKKKRYKVRANADYKTASILASAVKGVPTSEIARAMEMPRSSVQDILKKFTPVFDAIPKVNDFRAVKSDILAAGQIAALESAFSGNKLQKAGFLSTIQGFDILNKAERLELGKSTENVNNRHFGQLSVNLGALPDIPEE